MATYGRKQEVEEFIISLLDQDFPLRNIELIVVDQNDVIVLDDVIKKYSFFLKIVHVKSSKKGLSYNRNIGLNIAVGEFFCFPDDDCTYYNDTLSSVHKIFMSSEVDAVFGSIVSRATGRKIIKNWPCKKKKLTRWNFFFLYTSITIFVKKNNLKFDERFGVGAYYGSCEDTKYAYELVKLTKEINYYPGVNVWHPELDFSSITREKNYSYGLGFGAFCSNYKYDLFIIRIFFMSIIYHSLMLVPSLLLHGKVGFLIRLDSIWSRVKSFLSFGGNYE